MLCSKQTIHATNNDKTTNVQLQLQLQLRTTKIQSNENCRQSATAHQTTLAKPNKDPRCICPRHIQPRKASSVTDDGKGKCCSAVVGWYKTQNPQTPSPSILIQSYSKTGKKKNPLLARHQHHRILPLLFNLTSASNPSIISNFAIPSPLKKQIQTFLSDP